MKLFSICLLVMFNTGVYALDFFKGSYNEALQESRKSKKLLFIDLTTKWCIPCREMENSVFKDTSVIAYINKHFIAIQMDGEQFSSRDLCMRFKIGSWPSYLVIDPSDESLINRFHGKTKTPVFQAFLQRSVTHTGIENIAFNVNEAVIEFESSKKSGDDYRQLFHMLRMQSDSIGLLVYYGKQAAQDAKLKNPSLGLFRKSVQLMGEKNDINAYNEIHDYLVGQKFPEHQIEELAIAFYTISHNRERAKTSLDNFKRLGWSALGNDKQAFVSIYSLGLLNYAITNKDPEYGLIKLDQFAEQYKSLLKRFDTYSWSKRAYLYHRSIFLEMMGKHEEAKSIARSIINQYPAKLHELLPEYPEELQKIIEN